MSVSESAASAPTRWPIWLQPFRSIVWPGTGPRLDLKRDWPELTVIALATLLFWRGAPVADAPNAVEAAGRGLFHPIFGLPAALLGVTGGARFALLAGLLVAAGGMWWLGVVLGLGRPARLWASLTYAFAGGVGAGWMAGRFGLDLGYPWIPWALACALLAVRWRRRLYTAGAAAALALILLGGDFGLTCATVVVLALFLGVAGTGLCRERPYISLRRNEALIAALIGLLGLGLAATSAFAAIRRGPCRVPGNRSDGDRRRSWASSWITDRPTSRPAGCKWAVRLSGRCTVPVPGRPPRCGAAREPPHRAWAGAADRLGPALGCWQLVGPQRRIGCNFGVGCGRAAGVGRAGLRCAVALGRGQSEAASG